MAAGALLGAAKSFARGTLIRKLRTGMDVGQAAKSEFMWRSIDGLASLGKARLSRQADVPEPENPDPDKSNRDTPDSAVPKGKVKPRDIRTEDEGEALSQHGSQLVQGLSTVFVSTEAGFTKLKTAAAASGDSIARNIDRVTDFLARKMFGQPAQPHWVSQPRDERGRFKKAEEKQASWWDRFRGSKTVKPKARPRVKGSPLKRPGFMSRMGSKAGVGLRTLGRASIGLGGFISGWNAYKSSGSIGKGVAVGAGSIAGASIGARVGQVAIPIPLVGALAGGVAGSILGERAAETGYDWLFGPKDPTAKRKQAAADTNLIEIDRYQFTTTDKILFDVEETVTFTENGVAGSTSPGAAGPQKNARPGEPPKTAYDYAGELGGGSKGAISTSQEMWDAAGALGGAPAPRGGGDLASAVKSRGGGTPVSKETPTGTNQVPPPVGGLEKAEPEGRKRTSGDAALEKYPEGSQRFYHQRGNVSGLDPSLLDLVKDASKDLPAGYRMEMISGKDARSTGTTNHPNGLAADVVIVGPDGRAIPHDRGGPGMKMYEKMYQSVRERGKDKYPENEYIWGGTWISPAAGNGDPMHIQKRDPSIRSSSQTSGAYNPDRGAKGHVFESYLMSDQERKAYQESIRQKISSEKEARKPAPVAPPPSDAEMVANKNQVRMDAIKSPANPFMNAPQRPAATIMPPPASVTPQPVPAPAQQNSSQSPSSKSQAGFDGTVRDQEQQNAQPSFNDMAGTSHSD